VREKPLHVRVLDDGESNPYYTPLYGRMIGNVNIYRSTYLLRCSMVIDDGEALTKDKIRKED
jgi:hypothetical protein